MAGNTSSTDKKKSRFVDGAPMPWAAAGGVLHMTIKDAAKELDIPETYLRDLCRKNGFSQWPGKRVRFMNRIAGRNVTLEVMASSNGPVANPPPRKELITLNLIDKVGSSSSSGEDRN